MSTAPSVLREQMRTLYTEHHGWLYAWIRRKLGCAHNAADLAHDTFARVMASPGVPADLREPRAFLTTVAKGLLSNWRKRRALEEAYLAALAEMPMATVPPPEQRMLVLEGLHEIDMMLDALPPKVRHAFLLSQLDGLKYREIAREMRISEITVKRYMKRAFLQERADLLTSRLEGIPPGLAMRVLDRPDDPVRRQTIAKIVALLAVAPPSAWVGKRVIEGTQWTADFRTGVGEHREITLSDQTSVTLNTDSAIDVRFTDSVRELTLRAGEILVTTAQDTHPRPRPFRVVTAHGVLEPLGTRFNVRVEDNDTRLAVLEGAVAIESKGEAFARTVVAAGSQTSFTRSSVAQTRPVDETLTAWTSGMLIADKLPLAQLAREISRYRNGIVRCDPAVAAIPVSGAFPIADTRRTLAMLQATYAVRVQSTTSYWIVIAAR